MTAGPVKADCGANLIKRSYSQTALGSPWFHEEARCDAILWFSRSALGPWNAFDKRIQEGSGAGFQALFDNVIR